MGAPAALDMEGMDHAVAREPVMVGIARLELGIGAVAVIGTREAFGDFPFDGKRMKIILIVDGREITGKIGVDADGSVHGIPPTNGSLQGRFRPLLSDIAF